MDRNGYFYIMAVAVAALGTVIAVGALLDGVVVLPVVDGDDLLVGAGIAVAGAGAAMGFRRDRAPDASEPSGRKAS